MRIFQTGRQHCGTRGKRECTHATLSSASSSVRCAIWSQFLFLLHQHLSLASFLFPTLLTSMTTFLPLKEMRTSPKQRHLGQLSSQSVIFGATCWHGRRVTRVIVPSPPSRIASKYCGVVARLVLVLPRSRDLSTLSTFYFLVSCALAFTQSALVWRVSHASLDENIERRLSKHCPTLFRSSLVYCLPLIQSIRRQSHAWSDDASSCQDSSFCSVSLRTVVPEMLPPPPLLLPLPVPHSPPQSPLSRGACVRQRWRSLPCCARSRE